MSQGSVATREVWWNL